MKKIITALMLTLMCVMLIMPVSAEFVNPAVTDNAGYLTESQKAELEAKLEKLRETYNFDVAVYTEAEMSGDDPCSTADDLFDYRGYGGGEGKDGIMLYVSTEPRKYWFTTHGSGEEYFNENGLEYIESNVLPHLKEDDYNSAFEAYAEYSEELLDMAAQGTPYNEKHRSGMYIFCVIAGALIIPLVIASAATSSKLKKMKTARKKNHAQNYIKPGSFKVDFSQDIFLYSAVSRTKRAESDSDSGSHTSSSGESHGGCGGDY